MLALGAEPDALVLRNNCGVARVMGEDGVPRHVRFGLGVGSPDLVVILAPLGRVVGLEVKRPGEDATTEQAHVHAVWRHFGAQVAVVRSVADARTVIAEARASTLAPRSALSGG